MKIFDLATRGAAASEPTKKLSVRRVIGGARARGQQAREFVQRGLQAARSLRPTGGIGRNGAGGAVPLGDSDGGGNFYANAEDDAYIELESGSTHYSPSPTRSASTSTNTGGSGQLQQQQRVTPAGTVHATMNYSSATYAAPKPILPPASTIDDQRTPTRSQSPLPPPGGGLAVSPTVISLSTGAAGGVGGVGGGGGGVGGVSSSFSSPFLDRASMGGTSPAGGPATAGAGLNAAPWSRPVQAPSGSLGARAGIGLGGRTSSSESMSMSAAAVVNLLDSGSPPQSEQQQQRQPLQNQCIQGEEVRNDVSSAVLATLEGHTQL